MENEHNNLEANAKPLQVLSKTVILVFTVAAFAIVCLYWGPYRTVTIDLGKLENTSTNHVLVARTFKTALAENPNAQIVKVYLVAPPSNQWQFLQYNRKNKRVYFGPGGMTKTHGSGDQLVNKADLSCYWSEKSVIEELDLIMNKRAPADSFETAFYFFARMDLGACY